MERLPDRRSVVSAGYNPEAELLRDRIIASLLKVPSVSGAEALALIEAPADLAHTAGAAHHERHGRSRGAPRALRRAFH